MSRHNHDYTGCKHKLEFCAHCDTVYCTTCYKEWSTDRRIIEIYKNYPNYPWYGTTYSSSGGGVTSNGTAFVGTQMKAQLKNGGDEGPHAH